MRLVLGCVPDGGAAEQRGLIPAQRILQVIGVQCPIRFSHDARDAYAEAHAFLFNISSTTVMTSVYKSPGFDFSNTVRFVQQSYLTMSIV